MERIRSYHHWPAPEPPGYTTKSMEEEKAKGGPSLSDEKKKECEKKESFTTKQGKI